MGGVIADAISPHTEAPDRKPDHLVRHSARRNRLHLALLYYLK
jgi:hypothetical protein